MRQQISHRQIYDTAEAEYQRNLKNYDSEHSKNFGAAWHF